MEFTYEILFENHILYEKGISIKIIIIIIIIIITIIITIIISLQRLEQTEQQIKR